MLIPSVVVSGVYPGMIGAGILNFCMFSVRLWGQALYLIFYAILVLYGL